METANLSPDWSGKTILIAEDLDSNYTVIEALLTHTQVRIMRANNGSEAVDLLSKNQEINVILMDISMPEVDGIEALHQIRQQMPGKIVIAQTAHEISEAIEAAGFDDILQKPIRRNKLVPLLSKYL